MPNFTFSNTDGSGRWQIVQDKAFPQLWEAHMGRCRLRVVFRTDSRAARLTSFARAL